jgi:hypothetical protein
MEISYEEYSLFDAATAKLARDEYTSTLLSK